MNKPEFIVEEKYTFKDITQNHTIHVTFTSEVNINGNRCDNKKDCKTITNHVFFNKKTIFAKNFVAKNFAIVTN